MKSCYFAFLFCLVLQCLDKGTCDTYPYPLPGTDDAGPNTEDSRCKKAIDLAFVLDSSRSIPDIDFERQKQSVHDIVDLFDVRQNRTRIAAVSFGKELYPQFNFNKYRTKEAALNAIDNIDHSHGDATRTYLALKHTRQVLFNPSNGARDGIPHITVVFTDGQTNPGHGSISGNTAKAMTLEEARLMKAAGTYLFAVGIGPYVNKTELTHMASTPAEKFMIQVDSFSTLNNVAFRNLLAYHICQSDESTTPVPPSTATPPGPKPPGGDPNETCQGKPADIVFVLDESSSIHSEENFKTELRFVNEVIDFFNVGQGDHQSRIGVIGYSDNATVEFHLEKYNNKHEVQSAVSNIEWEGGNTFTDKALELSLQMFSPEHGSRGNVAQIEIIITDGNSTNPWKTKELAQQVQARGIYSFAIGVGPQVYDPELDILASDPNHLYKFKVDSLGALNTIKSLLAYTVCKEKKKNESAEKVCGQKQADIVFIADASTSIGESDFEKQREFIYHVVHNFDIGPDATRVALLTFSNHSHVQFDLNSYMDKQSLHNAIRHVHWTGGMTFTSEAIQMMMEHSFQAQHGARPGIPKIGIIITDGWSWEPEKTKANAADAQEMGITMFSIGVGNYIIPEELDAMASDPDDYHSFMVNDYSALDSITDALAIKACDISQEQTKSKREDDLKKLLRKFKYPVRT